MRITETKDENEIFQRLNMMRGMLAIVVLLSHIWGYSGIVFLVPFNKIVTIAVTFFFFLSGYGMFKSYRNNEEKYIFKIFRVKIPYLLWMAVVVYLFGVIIELVFLGLNLDDNTFTPIGIRHFVLSTNWYVYELIAFYIMFAIAMKLINEKYQLLFMAIISSIAFVCLFYSGLVEAYYNSIVGFLFGMFCYKYNFLNWKSKFKWLWIIALIILVIAFGGMFLLNRSSILFAIIRNIAAVAAIILCIFMVYKLDLCDKFFQYLSKISPEIYFFIFQLH